MTLNGKQDNFTKDGFYSVEKLSPIFSKRKIGDVFNQAIDTASHWNNLCIEQKVSNSLINEVRHNLMLILWNGMEWNKMNRTHTLIIPITRNFRLKSCDGVTEAVIGRADAFKLPST